MSHLSLHHRQEFMIGHILLSSCLSQAGQPISESLLSTLVTYFKTKDSLREAVADALAGLALTKAQFKKLAEVGDINYWRLKLGAAKSASGLLSHTYKLKSSLIEGSYRTLPRCHSVWHVVLRAAKAEGAFEKVWGVFVEKELGSLANHKNRGRHIGFSIALALQALQEGLSVTEILTPEFMKSWHSNLCDREHRHHDSAVKLKQLAVKEVKETALEKVVSLVQTVTVGDLVTSLTLAAVKTASTQQLANVITTLTVCTEPRLSHFVVLMLEAISKHPGLEETALVELLTKAHSEDLARRKLFATLTHSDLSLISSIFQVWEGKPAEVWERFHAETAAAEPKLVLGKRKAYEGLVTEVQKQALWKLVLLVTLESAFDPASDVHTELIESVDSLLHPKPSKRTKAEAESPLEALFDTLLTLLNKQAAYRRDLVKATFKEFVAEVPIGFVETLCGAVLTGDGFVMEEIQEDITGEEVELTAEQAETMLAATVPSKAQMESLRTDYRLRACDLVEVLIKKSEDSAVLLKIYSALFTALQQCKVPNLKSRLVALLGKLSKSKLVLKTNSLETAVTLLSSSIKAVASQALIALRPCVLSLAKAVAEVDFESAKTAYGELLRLYIEKHTRKELYSLLTQLLSSLPALADDDLLKVLVKYSSGAKQTHSQLQALSLIKLVLAKHATSLKISKLLKSTLKTKTKQADALPSKDWMKKSLSVFAISCKGSGYSEGVGRVLGRLEKKYSGVTSVKSLISQVKQTLALS
jgi:hypothetical protein